MEMTSVTVGIASVIAIVVSIYSGVHIAIALGLISFVGVSILRNTDIAFSLLSLTSCSGRCAAAWGSRRWSPTRSSPR
jgi:hypothetical protein